MKKLSKIFFTLILTLGIGFNSFINVDAAISSEQWINNYIPENYIGIQNEDMIYDFTYLWETLNKNYPYLGVVERSGVDINNLYNKYMEKIKNCRTDFDFYYTLLDFTKEFKEIGHLNLISPSTLSSFNSTYVSASMTSDEAEKHLKPWVTALNAPNTLKSYALYNLIVNPPELVAIIENETGKKLLEDTNFIPAIETQIMEDNKVGYLKIDTFSYSAIDNSIPIILNFYNEIQDCTDLIIDIRNNGGGAVSYWTSLLVAPNIDKEYKSESYDLVLMGENNKKYIDFEILPMNELPEFENILQEDLERFDGFRKTDTVVRPISNQKLFNGRIWILVGPQVYSSAENFVIFCKDTGFATIVGTPTGGDGIGGDPVFASLPKSGLLVRYSMDYGINPDGRGNEEFGTIPDIISPDGEDALETCLKEIRKK